jgi:hypothetical protein
MNTAVGGSAYPSSQCDKSSMDEPRARANAGTPPHILNARRRVRMQGVVSGICPKKVTPTGPVVCALSNTLVGPLTRRPRQAHARIAGNRWPSEDRVMVRAAAVLGPFAGEDKAAQLIEAAARARYGRREAIHASRRCSRSPLEPTMASRKRTAPRSSSASWFNSTSSQASCPRYRLTW